MVASAVSRRARCWATVAGRPRRGHATMDRWIGNFSESGRPVIVDNVRTHAEYSPHPTIGGVRWYMEYRDS